jgi:RNA polymerase sigma-70 factor, ECF subfamily
MDPESSIELLQRVKAGDHDALERLLTRYLGPLRRWAHGRLPQWARDLSDTQDLVQDSVVKTLRQLQDFEPAGPGALQAYLRSAVMNRIRDELRRASRRPPPVELDDEFASGATSPLEGAIGKEALGRYHAALAQLGEETRELVIARVELGMSYEELAAIFDKPTAAAARVAVRRAVIKVVSLMEPPDVTVKAV